MGGWRRSRSRRGAGDGTPRPVGTLLDQLLDRRHLKRPLRIYRLRAAWRELAGAVAARRSFPSSLRQGRLNVAVADSVWLQELTYLKAALLERVQALMGQDVVQELRFHVRPGAGTPEPTESAPEVSDAELETQLRQRPLAPEVAAELSRFEEELDEVDNPDLRRAIRRAYIQHLLR